MAKDTGTKSKGAKGNAKDPAGGATIAPEGSVKFFKESYQEIKKVHPPTREETIRMTMIVLVAMVFFAAFLGMADFFVGRVMRTIIT